MPKGVKKVSTPKVEKVEAEEPKITYKEFIQDGIKYRKAFNEKGDALDISIVE